MYHTRLIHSTSMAIRSPCHTTYWPYWEKKPLVIISFTGVKNQQTTAHRTGLNHTGFSPTNNQPGKLFSRHRGVPLTTSPTGSPRPFVSVPHPGRGDSSPGNFGYSPPRTSVKNVGRILRQAVRTTPPPCRPTGALLRCFPKVLTLFPAIFPSAASAPR